MKYWTKEDNEFLIENYTDMTRKEIGDYLGRSEGSVRTKCHRIGLNTKKESQWTEEELSLLKELYSQNDGLWFSLDEIADKIGRSRWGVAMKASRIGLGDYERKKPGGRIERRKFKGDREAELKYRSEVMRNWYKNNEHPRGFSGKYHSEETKKIIKKKSQEYFDNELPMETAIRINKSMETRLKNYGTLAPIHFREGNMYSRTKGGKREDLNDMYFRSSWEANYARYLNFLMDNEEIIKWEYEVDKFDFPVERGTREYTPDFKIFENDGRIVYHEVKGWMDAKSKTKLKRMAKYYPEEVVIIVGEDEYKAISKQVRNLIPNWEINKGI